jgi:hypothetical protein
VGYSRDSFYRFKELYDKGGELALQEISRKKPILKNRTPVDIEQAAVEIAIEQPAWGQIRVSQALKRRGLSISPAGVRCVWQRHDLTSNKAPAEGARSQGGAGGHPADRGADRRAREGQGRQGSARRVRERMPWLLRGAGHLLCRHAQGVGQIYQQTVIDTYAKVAFAKLYDRKTPITAAEILNDRVVPFYDERGIPLCRVLTDRGTEFCGSESHQYELYLAVEDIDHSPTKAKSPQTNGICANRSEQRVSRVLHRSRSGAVRYFHTVGLALGGIDNGAPGYRRNAFAARLAPPGFRTRLASCHYARLGVLQRCDRHACDIVHFGIAVEYSVGPP